MEYSWYACKYREQQQDIELQLLTATTQWVTTFNSNNTMSYNF